MTVIDSAVDLDLMARACLAILRRRKDPDLVWRMLYWLEEAKGPYLSAQTHEQYLLEVSLTMQDFEAYRNRSRRLWRLARAVQSRFVKPHPHQEGYIRFGARLMFVHTNGISFLSEDWRKHLPAVDEIRITSGPLPPRGVLFSKASVLAPDIHTWVSADDFHGRRLFIERQYRRGSVMLLMMLVLGLLFTAAIAFLLLRERELAKMKNEFIATVSHELRTPLSLIRLFAETVYHGRVSDKKKQYYFQNILNETERLSLLINNILDFSRTPAYDSRPDLKETDMSRLTAKVIDMFLPRLRKENFKIFLKIEPDIIMRTDPLAYSQVLFNLMDNAIKYSDSEKEIEVSLRRLNGECVLCTADKGIGIPDNMKRKIFLPFFRLRDRRVSARRGSGVGLSVVKKITDQLNGKISVTDNSPRGTVFSISLPAMETMNESTNC